MPSPGRELAGGDEHEVTPLELFFDLVFVFAITQVTKLLTSEPTWGGLLRGMLVLAAVWWAWTTYAWLTSAIDVDEGAVRLTMLASTAIMLGVALAVPRAFGADAVLFGVAYLLVRLIHFVLSAVVGRDDLVRRGVLLRFAPTSYLHLPMVAGIVLFALGLKATLHHVGTELDTLPAVGLCAGAAYLLAHIAFLWRTTGRVFRRRTAGAACCSPSSRRRSQFPLLRRLRSSAASARWSWRTRRSATATAACGFATPTSWPERDLRCHTRQDPARFRPQNLSPERASVRSGSGFFRDQREHRLGPCRVFAGAGVGGPESDNCGDEQ